MKIDKKFKGLVNEGWRYRFDDDIETTESLEIDLDMGLFITGSIEAGGSIKAGEFIEAGGSIEAGESIEAGGSYGIVAGLSITCKTTLSFGLRLFAGTCNWRDINDEEKTVTCGKLLNGIIEYGILVETGLEEEVESDDKTEEAVELLKSKGYKIIKE